MDDGQYLHAIAVLRGLVVDELPRLRRLAGVNPRRFLSCDLCEASFHTVPERVAHYKAEHPTSIAGGGGQS